MPTLMHRAAVLCGPLALALVLIVLLTGQTTAPASVSTTNWQHITAHSIRIVDDQGISVIEIGRRETGVPAIQFYDQQGCLRLALLYDSTPTSGGDTKGLILYGPDGKRRIRVTQGYSTLHSLTTGHLTSDTLWAKTLNASKAADINKLTCYTINGRSIPDSTDGGWR